MTSATEVLRRLLDERRVEWSATTGAAGTIWTHWDAFNGYRVHAMDNGDGTVEIFGEWDVTPAQAIAATLGATDAKPTQVESSGTCEADETDTWECVRDDLGGYGKTMTVHVMKCTECGHVYEHVNGDYEYCPRCGRKRRDVEE